jgi:sugar lactone lactonase YvrE
MVVAIFIDVSYNQPKLSPWTTWKPNAITFADNQTVGGQTYGLFVDINDTVYVAARSLNQIQVWVEGSTTPVRNISGGLIEPLTVFASTSGNVYVDNSLFNGRVDMWMPNSTSSIAAMYVNGGCFGLFADIHENIYCSDGNHHQVLKKSFKDPANASITVAGTGISGAASNMLNNPRGIFVDSAFKLYVADCYNNRIQLFTPGQSNGTTVLGNGATTATITLSCPDSVILDADGHLFVSDLGNARVVGWGLHSYQCVAACNGYAGSNSDSLHDPVTLSFDSYGNIFIADAFNNRIQKYLIMNNSRKFLTERVKESGHYHFHLYGMW